MRTSTALHQEVFFGGALSMNLRQLIPAECVILELSSSEHEDVIREMVAHLASIGKILVEDCSRFSEAVIGRELQVGTGLGSGVAIPHARVEGPDEILAVFARSKEGVDFESPDNAPAHCIVLLLAPEGQTAKHLQTLSELAKVFSQCECREELQAATTAAEISAIFSSEAIQPH
ncbi:PTS sugar transporter subunit IIA [Akkermansiaceae bacterium]|nr:PTS sugar transporter subunit IIA [Akkermansiaceae bacterium]